jgi:hypothetical protein
MSTAPMTDRMAEASPRFTAPDVRTRSFRTAGFRTKGFRTRMAGVLYLVGVLTAAFAEIFLRGRLSVAGGLVAVLAMIAVTLPFYEGLSSMSRRLSLLAAFFNVVGFAFEVLRLQPQGVNVAVVFDGFYCVLVGYLAFGSSLLPRIPGALMALGGLGWLTFFSPPLANLLSPYNLALGLVGEGLVMLWLLVIGVDVQRLEQASATGERQ